MTTICHYITFYIAEQVVILIVVLLLYLLYMYFTVFSSKFAANFQSTFFKNKSGALLLILIYLWSDYSQIFNKHHILR